MNNELFSVASMPPSRPADYYLCYRDGCVFMDFNNCADGKVRLIRISFDGYGCCEWTEQAKPLSEEQSVIFRNMVQTNIIHQNTLCTIVKDTIKSNKELIWLDALEEYDLI